MLGLFRNKSKEDKFWQWFSANEDRIFEFEADQEQVFESITYQLRKIHPSLVFEISREVEGKREFVISADGIRDVFPFVESTFAKAPALERWTFVKFRPRSGTGLYIEFDDGFKLAPDELKFALAREGAKIAIGVFARDYFPKDRDRYARSIFVLLDTALGEYDMETKVGAIDIEGWNQLDEMEIKGQPFSELPDSFDRMWASSLN